MEHPALLPIETLLPDNKRSVALLRVEGIEYIGQLCFLSQKTLENHVSGFAKKTTKDVKEAMIGFGLELGGIKSYNVDSPEFAEVKKGGLELLRKTFVDTPQLARDVADAPGFSRVVKAALGAFAKEMPNASQVTLDTLHRSVAAAVALAFAVEMSGQAKLPDGPTKP